MNEKQKKICLTIIKELKEHPITKPFHEPILPGSDAPVNYFEIIKKPIDLRTITNNINENKYLKITQFFKDIDLIFKNAENYNETVSLMGYCAKKSKEIFEKKTRLASNISLEIWSLENYRLKNKITELLTKSPSKIKNYFNNKYLKEKLNLFTEKELFNLVKATEMLTNNEEQKELINIIKNNQPELDNGSKNLLIDITKCNLNTLYLIKDFIKNLFEKKNLNYPE